MSRKEWAPLRPVVETPEGIGHTLPEGPVAPACDLPPTRWPEPENSEPGPGHAAGPDQRTIEMLITTNNRIDVGRSERSRVYFIRFRNDPDKGRADGRRPVVDHMKTAGFRYQRIPGEGMAWQKPYAEEAVSISDEMAVREVARDAAKIMEALRAHGKVR